MQIPQKSRVTAWMVTGITKEMDTRTAITRVMGKTTGIKEAGMDHRMAMDNGGTMAKVRAMAGQDQAKAIPAGDALVRSMPCTRSHMRPRVWLKWCVLEVLSAEP